MIVISQGLSQERRLIGSKDMHLSRPTPSSLYGSPSVLANYRYLEHNINIFQEFYHVIIDILAASHANHALPTHS